MNEITMNEITILINSFIETYNSEIDKMNDELNGIFLDEEDIETQNDFFHTKINNLDEAKIPHLDEELFDLYVSIQNLRKKTK